MKSEMKNAMQKPSLSARRKYPARLTCLCLSALLLACFLPGCSTQGGNGKSLYEHGLDVIGLMEEMVKNNNYSELSGTASGELETLRGSLAAGDYTTPQAVYEVTVPDMGKVLALLGEGNPMDSFSDALQAHLNKRSAALLVNQLNARQGSAALATASIYTAAKTFVNRELEQNTLYLYTFQDGYSVMVTFVTGEDHSVTATGTFLMGADFTTSSVEQLGDLLKGAGITGAIKEVKP